MEGDALGRKFNVWDPCGILRDHIDVNVLL